MHFQNVGKKTQPLYAPETEAPGPSGSAFCLITYDDKPVTLLISLESSLDFFGWTGVDFWLKERLLSNNFGFMNALIEAISI